MNRRVFLGTVGSLASVGTLAYTTREPVETLEVGVWLSPGAGSYEGVSDRIREYVEAMLDLEYWSLELSIGGIVDVSTEDGARVTSRGEWPRILAAGAIGQHDITPADDVNLLVTDGQMKEAPTGYGLPHVASVGGAQHIASLPPLDELVSTPQADADRWIVPNKRPTRTIQVLLHEIGHALGLDHEHGVSFRYDNAVIATPMLSSYAWTDDYDGEHSHCGALYPDPSDHARKLSLAFSNCARRELVEYNGTILD